MDKKYLEVKRLLENLFDDRLTVGESVSLATSIETHGDWIRSYDKIIEGYVENHELERLNKKGLLDDEKTIRWIRKKRADCLMI